MKHSVFNEYLKRGQAVPLSGAPGHFLQLEVKPRGSKEEKTVEKNTRNKHTDLMNNLFYLLKQFLHSLLTHSERMNESSGKKFQSLPPSTPAPKVTLLLPIGPSCPVAPW